MSLCKIKHANEGSNPNISPLKPVARLQEGFCWGVTHPLLFMPVHVQRGAAVAAAPLGQQRVLIVAEHDLFRIGGWGRLGGDVLRPGCVQGLDGGGQQLTVAHRHKLTRLKTNVKYELKSTKKTNNKNQSQRSQKPCRSEWRESSPGRWRIGLWRLGRASRRSS